MNTITHESGFEIDHDESIQTPPNDVNTDPSNGRSLSTFLRLFGACAVVASLSMFLIEGWTDGNDLARYMKLLAQTGLITAAGLFLSFVVKEVKGARVFFGLGLAAATANFTILGALVYSIFQLDGALGDYPSMLQWQAVSVSSFLPLAMCAIALLSLLSRFSFSIFARNYASRLTMTFLALNALLLIPVREALYVSALAAIALLVATQVTLSVVRSQKLLMTNEAKYALACLFMPGIIIVTRALGLYAVDEIVLLTLSSLVYYALRSTGQMLAQSARPQKVLSTLQYLIGLMIAGLAVSLLPNQASSIEALVFSLIVLGITYDQVTLQRETQTNMRSLFIIATSVILALANVVSALTSSLVLIQFLSVVALAGLLTSINLWSKTIEGLNASRLIAVISIAIVSLSVIVSMVNLLNVGAWVLVGGSGIALIVIASLFERFGLNLPKVGRQNLSHSA